MQNQVKKLYITTTEPLEHTLDTAHSWKREFTVCEFISFCNKLKSIMKNVLENDIIPSRSGFLGQKMATWKQILIVHIMYN